MSLTAEQQEIRRRGVGSSDIAAIAGLNPYRTPLDVWLDKTGRREPEPDTSATQAGRALEPIIAGWYADERKVRLVPGQTQARDEWKVATPDFEILESILDMRERNLAALLEVKNVGARMAFKWPETGVPEYVLAQVLWQMHVCKVERADVAVFLGGNEFRIERVDQVPEILADLVSVADDFWRKYVKRDVEPPKDASDAWSYYVARKWPKEQKPIKPAPAEAEALAEKLRTATAAFKLAEAEKTKLEHELCDLIGDAAGIASSTWCATWKTVAEGKVAAHTRKAYRRFNFNGAWKASGR